MARREVIDCDRCGEKAVPSPVVVHAHVGWEACPAGGPSERDVRRLDLCPKCAASLLTAAVEAMGEDAAAKWYELARKSKRC